MRIYCNREQKQNHTMLKTGHFYTRLLAALSFCLLSVSQLSVASATVENTSDAEEAKRVSVEWIEPNKYSDTRSANGPQSKHREHIFAQLEKHLASLAEDLPEGQSLNLKVNNLDLAGRVEPGRFSGVMNTMNDIRVLRQIDIPRMKFTYELISAEGEVIKTEDVNLKDMNFLSGVSVRNRERPFAYEKRMLTRWFERELLETKS